MKLHKNARPIDYDILFMLIMIEILAADTRALNEFFQRIVEKFRAAIRKTGNVD